MLAELSVMLDKQDRWCIGQQQLLNLHPGDDVDIIERFIPDEQMGLLTQTASDQHLFLLPAAVGSNEICSRLPTSTLPL